MPDSDAQVGINDCPNPLTSSSFPFEIDGFRSEGTAAVGPTPGELTVTGKPHDERRSHPLVTSAVAGLADLRFRSFIGQNRADRRIPLLVPIEAA